MPPRPSPLLSAQAAAITPPTPRPPIAPAAEPLPKSAPTVFEADGGEAIEVAADVDADDSDEDDDIDKDIDDVGVKASLDSVFIIFLCFFFF